ncbi:acyl-CoA dehydrogenase [Pseudomaricurvus alkylphenolicus]|jgi:alkylation response protein AidB-like acyl-CoA dehydrogenase|uniref:acyl-CoA dehydrogenase family protein n=1 Tax=Pseudomaricurvus alkylphenolicus TaxID=1306991 RepID=UPI00142118D2|nr:acyl-CoA dehydrogenase family protein [Pseudomaricurvus alkylphenolicus]NIB41408.1 acyl-CoA dehydrogenase [Pseudomaricurvus alkylphenolicus]
MSTAENRDTPEQAEFRAYCRQWLKHNHPGEPPVSLPQSELELSDPHALEWLQAWQRSAYEAGLIGSDFATEHGGGGRTDCQRIANQEMQAAKTPFFPNLIGLRMSAPPILLHGKEEVKRELLPKLLSGEEIWCQGFSEPGAGSDLANQQTFAERKGDEWIINGHKVWTTMAHFASWMILLCRTSKDDKYKGLSYFVVPMKSEGVSVRPLIKMTGETGFNEVFFENVVLDDRYRLGEVGDGWQVAMTTLAHERGAGPIVIPQAGGMDTEEKLDVYNTEPLIALAKKSYRNGEPAADDPGVRDRLVQLIIREQAIKENDRRQRVPELNDHPARLALQHKLLGSEFAQDLAQLSYDIEGIGSSLYTNDPNALDGGQWPLAYMNSFGMTIAAGTNEIQRNILGERVLGLPKTK